MKTGQVVSRVLTVMVLGAGVGVPAAHAERDPPAPGGLHIELERSAEWGQIAITFMNSGDEVVQVPSAGGLAQSCRLEVEAELELQHSYDIFPTISEAHSIRLEPIWRSLSASVPPIPRRTRTAYVSVFRNVPRPASSQTTRWSEIQTKGHLEQQTLRIVCSLEDGRQMPSNSIRLYGMELPPGEHELRGLAEGIRLAVVAWMEETGNYVGNWDSWGRAGAPSFSEAVASYQRHGQLAVRLNKRIPWFYVHGDVATKLAIPGLPDWHVEVVRHAGSTWSVDEAHRVPER